MANVKLHDGPLRWLVESQSRAGEWHLVSLAGSEGKRCDCRYHQTTVGPALRRGEVPKKMCAHFYLARNAFCELMLEELGKRDLNTKEQQ